MTVILKFVLYFALIVLYNMARARSECIHSSYYQLLPTQMPHHLKNLILPVKGGDFNLFVRLVVKALIYPHTNQAKCTRITRSIQQHYLCLNDKLRSFLAVFYKIDTAFFTNRRHHSYLARVPGYQVVFANQFHGKTLLLKLNPQNLWFRKLMNREIRTTFSKLSCLIHVVVPLRYHVNMSLQYLPRPSHCSFLTRFVVKHKLGNNYLKTQFVFDVLFHNSQSFIPWSVVVQNHKHGVFVDIELTLFHNEQMNCTSELFIVHYQPVMTPYFSYPLPYPVNDGDPYACMFSFVALATAGDIRGGNFAPGTRTVYTI